jgi:hypothetical protein
MKKLICLLLLFISKAAASNFSYGDVHTLGGYPMVGGGIRAEQGMVGIDLSANACPLNFPKSLSVFHLRGLSLFYPLRGIYIGCGVGYFNEPESIGMGSSFEGSLGLEWKMGRHAAVFAEIDATLPLMLLKLGDAPTIWPGLTTGFCF